MSDADPSPLTSSLRTYRHRLDHLSAAGRRILESLAITSASDRALEAVQVWQRECAATISQLSGGTKVHWLARAYSEALLVPLPPTESASVTTIVERILNVLDRADASLAQIDVTQPSEPPAAEAPRERFRFVEDQALRANLERAYIDARAALSRGESALALITYCSILEAVITDALHRQRVEGLAAHDPPAGPIADWPFESRIALAQRAGLISGGCARLPAVARHYRGLLDAGGALEEGVSISADEAKRAGQVLHVILRDFAPGR